MMRFTTMAIIGSFAMLIVGYAIWPERARIAPPQLALAQQGSESQPQTDDAAQPSAATMKNRAVYEKLDREAGADFTYEDELLIDVQHDLQEKIGVPIILHSSTSEEGKLEFDSSVSFRGQGMRLQSALDLMLDKYDCTFTVREGVIIFISKDAAQNPEFAERAIINVDSLLKKIAQREAGRLQAANQGQTQIFVGSGAYSQGGFGGGGGLGGGVFSIQSGGVAVPAANNQTPSNPLSQLESTNDSGHQIVLKGPVTVVHGDVQTAETMLLDVVFRSVNPDGWNTGQGLNDAQILGGQLIVMADRSTINGVRDFILDLDAAMGN